MASSPKLDFSLLSFTGVPWEEVRERILEREA